MTSQDATFNEEFILALDSTQDIYHGGQKMRTVGTGYIPHLYPLESQVTRDIVNIISQGSNMMEMGDGAFINTLHELLEPEITS